MMTLTIAYDLSDNFGHMDPVRIQNKLHKKKNTGMTICPETVIKTATLSVTMARAQLLSGLWNT